MDELLKLLKSNALESAENLGRMLGMSADDVRERVREYEDQGVIKGYQAVVDEDELDVERVTAVIEVKVQPEREGGFDRVAQRIARFDEVDSAYLMSGAFDLLLFVSGTNLRQVATFISEKLASLDGVTGTSTAFMLKTYKHHGILMKTEDEYERLQVSP